MSGQRVESEHGSVFEVLQRRASVRDFKTDDLDERLVSDILRAAQRAPTSSNLQAYSFVVVRDPATRIRLCELAGNQEHIRVAPVFVAVCADIYRLSNVCALHGEELAADNLEMCLVAAIDASLAGMCASLAAESLGLGCVMIGGIRNAPAEAAKLLHLPWGAFVVYGLCLGWPAQRPSPKPRLDPDAVIHRDRYDASGARKALTDYDQALADYYRDSGKTFSPDPWTLRIAESFSHPHRDYLRSVLAERGFRFR